jgi:hypothetical protein
MRSRRPRTALTLVGMGIVLLAAVAVGQQIGEHTIFGATERRVQIPEQVITPVPEDTPGVNEEISRNWKRLQVVSVATDPAFPDPRVTPTPVPTPRPTPTPKPTPVPTPNTVQLYTSPPLPIPLVSQDPAAATTPDVAR